MSVRNEVKAQIVRAGFTMQEVVDPVSYTHLDVYKRQFQGYWKYIQGHQ